MERQGSAWHCLPRPPTSTRPGTAHSCSLPWPVARHRREAGRARMPGPDARVEVGPASREIVAAGPAWGPSNFDEQELAAAAMARTGRSCLQPAASINSSSAQASMLRLPVANTLDWRYTMMLYYDTSMKGEHMKK